MAIYTKISKNNIASIEKKFNLGKIISFKGIKKGIENTNYLIKKEVDVEIKEVEIIKENIVFKTPGKLN